MKNKIHVYKLRKAAHSVISFISIPFSFVLMFRTEWHKFANNVLQLLKQEHKSKLLQEI